MSDHIKIKNTLNLLLEIESIERKIGNFERDIENYQSRITHLNEKERSLGGTLFSLILVTALIYYFTWNWSVFIKYPLYIILIVCTFIFIKNYKKNYFSKKDKERQIKSLAENVPDSNQLMIYERELSIALAKLKSNTSLHSKYKNVNNCRNLLQYFNQGRAKSLQEAINILESENKQREFHNRVLIEQGRQERAAERAQKAAHESQIKQQKTLENIHKELEKTRKETERLRSELEYRD